MYEKLFRDILYIDDTHKYIDLVTGNEIISVTKFIKQFSKPFDEAYYLPKKAKELGVTEEELKKEWSLKSLIGTSTGTIIHNYLENRFKNKIFKQDIPEYLDAEKVNRLLQSAEKYYQENKDLDIAALELTVGNSKLAGTLDKLIEGGIIRDYKTGELKQGWDYMYEPFTFILDSSLNKYSIQLNCYRQLLEEKGVKINKMEIVFFTEEGYEIHNVEFLNVPI